MITIPVVSSWSDAYCGIASHTRLLKQAVEEAYPDLQILPCESWLGPHAMDVRPPILVLNYHRALHSRWTPEVVRHVRTTGTKIVTIFHDTVGELPPDQLAQDLCQHSDAFIVHEPCQGLPTATYWRMGVPEPIGLDGYASPFEGTRPQLGTCGHDFPWKNWERLCEVAAAAGWGVVICCPRMTPARDQELRSRNPWVTVWQGLSQDALIATLGTCDATAFLFTCANSGQSASILQGIAARKPLYAFYTCRQFRSLFKDADHSKGAHPTAISWIETFEDLEAWLVRQPISVFSAPMTRLAEQESWRHLGKKYAELFRSLL